MDAKTLRGLKLRALQALNANAKSLMTGQEVLSSITSLRKFSEVATPQLVYDLLSEYEKLVAAAKSLRTGLQLDHPEAAKIVPEAALAALDHALLEAELEPPLNPQTKIQK